MKVIVGLGNPGKQYQKTRHNIGFMAVDRVVNQLNGKFTLNQKLRSEIYETTLFDEKILFVKPITYMNLSGEAVKSIIEYYQVDINDILVIYDDLDLPLAKVRIRPGGSSGGHKGMQSIINHLHTDKIKRVRIGISSPLREDTIDFVLGKFSKEERKLIDKTLELTYDIIVDFIRNSFDVVMNTYN